MNANEESRKQAKDDVIQIYLANDDEPIADIVRRIEGDFFPEKYSAYKLPPFQQL